MDVVITRCSNNYGTHHFPEKLIPLFITNLLEEKKVPVYGTGKNVRDWVYVEDHCRAIYLTLTEGVPGEIYNVGGGNEYTNLELVKTLLKILDKSESLIEFTADRLGHDRRYSVNYDKISELGFKVEKDIEKLLVKTIRWYESKLKGERL
jgi:dTDP-glucose 4,6-dehydratase